MVHYMQLYEEPFLKIKNREKTIEIRCNDEKRRRITVGDTIVFHKLPDREESLTVEVVDLYPCSTFIELYSRFPSEDFGWKNTSPECMLEGIREIYSEESEKTNGVLGIRIKLLAEDEQKAVEFDNVVQVFTVPPEEDYVKILGRTLVRDGIRYLNYSCACVEFEFIGTRAEAVLCSNVAYFDGEHKAWAAVFINDEDTPSKRIRLDRKEASYLLYEGEAVRNTRIRLVKYSEAAFGMLGVKSITVFGIHPPKPAQKKQRKIEFIGDSITCGYGNEGRFNVDAFTTAQENPWDAYAAKTARALEADYHLISWSGIGIISNYTEQDVPNDGWLMPGLYPFTDKAADLSLGSNEIEAWDSNRFQPDCIVINLGTNDSSYTRNIPERVATFGNEYYNFIKQVRKSNPGSVILCTIGVMGQDLYAEIDRQVRLLSQEGDGNIYSLLFDNQSETDGLGAKWHPSKITHAKMAVKLEARIREIMNWN